MAQDLLRICSEPVDINEAYAALLDPRFGAQLVFTGTVRNENDGRPVEAVSYEAFVEMALAVFSELAAEVRTRCPAELGIVLIHRTGRLLVSEISTVVGVAGPHRAETYEASRYLIEQVKQRLPVWKEEHYTDGKSTWLDGAQIPCGGDSSRGAVIPHGQK